MKPVLGSIVVLGGLLAVGPVSMRAAAPQATTTATDHTLDERIETRIHASTLKKYDIDVKVNNGVAMLTGTVSTEAERRKAGQLATVPGVARVDNQLVVKPDTKGTAGTVQRKTDKAAEKTKEGVNKAVDKTKEGGEKAWEKTKEGAGAVADKTKEGLSKTGEVITDGWILSRVKMKFVGEDVLKGSDINVDVKDHVVTLSGTVPSAAARARAIEQAKEVEGVHQVMDRLTIGPKKH